MNKYYIKSYYYKEEDKKQKYYWKFVSIFLLFNRIFYYIIYYYTINYNFSYLSFIESFLNFLFFIFDLSFYVPIVILIPILYYKIKNRDDNRINFKDNIILIISLIIIEIFIIILILSNYNYLSYNIIIFFQNILYNFILWTLKILFFFWPWILILIYYFIKNYSLIYNFKYRISDFKIKDSLIIINSKNNKRKKAIAILEIKNIPKKISSREKRHRNKNTELITFGNKNVYFYYHLTVLMKYIPNLSYEISIHRNRVKFRLILTLEHKKLSDLIEHIKNLIEIIIEIYQTSFPGLKFEILSGNKLKFAWSEIFGGYGDFKIKFIKNDIIRISQLEKDLFIRIIKIKDKPQIKANLERTQIDNLVASLLGSNIYSCSFIVNIKPIEILKFTSNRFNNYKDSFYHDLDFKSDNNPELIRKFLLNVKHSEITGLWEVSTYFILRSLNLDKIEGETKKVMAILDTVFSGNENSIKTKIINKKNLPYTFSIIINRQALKDTIQLTSEQLATYLHLPEESFPSIERTDIPIFEIPPEDYVNEKISIGHILFQNNKELYKIGIDIEDLRLNMFVTGLIGMGKTTFVMNILKKLSKFYSGINWIVLDWKGDYVSLMKEVPQGVLILRPGTKEAPLQINMFDPQNSNPNEHARKLLALIIELFKSDFANKPELSVQMERVCREVIDKVVSDFNKRSLNAFFEYLEEYKEQEKARNPTVIMTINAIINRFDRFRRGILKEVFDVKNSNINFDEIMNYKVVFDFNYLLSNGGTKEDVRFLMNLILKYVIDKALQRGIINELKHIVVIEDAQLLVPAVLREVPETSMGEDIPLLLRGVGESMITIATRPEISPDIISNSGIKVSFKSTYDSKKIANYQNLTQEQEEYLRIMPKREAIITIPSFQFPFRIKTEEIYFKKCTNKEIYINNKNNFPFIFKNLNINEIEEDLMKNEDNTKIITENNDIQSKNNNIQSNKIKLNKLEINIKQNNFKISDELINKILNQLKEIPKNKYQLSRELNIKLKDIENILEFMLERNLINSEIGPIFSNGKLQRLFYTKNINEYINNEIKLKIERDFVRPGTFGPLKDKFFDYIWYFEDVFIKIYYKKFNKLTKNKFIKDITNLMTYLIQKDKFEFILIIPFIQWKERILKWLNENNLNNIYVFSFNKNDWEKLRNFLKEDYYYKDENDEIDYEIDDETQIYHDLKQSESNIDNNKDNLILLNTNNINQLENQKINIKSTSNNFNELQNVSELIQKFSEIYPVEFLKRLTNNFPKDTEIYEWLGCDKFTINKHLKLIRPYIKEVLVHDIYDPIKEQHTYYGWKNFIKGKYIMQSNLSEILREYHIKFLNNYNCSFNNLNIEICFDIFLPDYSIYIFLIYNEDDLTYLNKIFNLLENYKMDLRLVIITHTTELKSLLQKKYVSKEFIEKIKILKYDWIEIDPWLRKISKN